MKWEIINLGEAATFYNGYAFKPEHWSDKGKEIIRIQNLTKGSSQTNFFEGNINERYKVTKGDLLISWSATLGIYEWMKDDAWLNQHIFKVVFDKKEFDKSFFKHLISSSLRKMEQQVHGATMKHITKKKFDAFKIPLPPLETQKKIAEILDEADKLRQLNKQLIKKYDALTQSLFLDMFGDPVTNPKGWEILKLEEFCEFENGDRSSNYPSGNDIKQSGKLFLSSGDIKKAKFKVKDSKYISEEKFNSLKRGKCYRNDILMTLRGNGTGKSAVFDCEFDEGFINAQMVIIRPNNKCTPQYLVFQLNCLPIFRRLINLNSGSAQPQLSAKNVKEFDVFVPPIAIQNQFTERVKVIEKQKAQAQQALRKSEDLFNSLLQKAFKGELIKNIEL